MKKLFYALIISNLPLFLYAADSDFSYDKKELYREFSQLDKVADHIEKTNATYEEVSKNPVFVEDIKLSKRISLKPTFDLDDMDWDSFAWGFCCPPAGFFIVGISDDKTKDQKTSFWIGVVTIILLAGGFRGIYGPIALV